jgi:hypothetical protein
MEISVPVDFVFINDQLKHIKTKVYTIKIEESNYEHLKATCIDIGDILNEMKGGVEKHIKCTVRLIAKAIETDTRGNFRAILEWDQSTLEAEFIQHFKITQDRTVMVSYKLAITEQSIKLLNIVLE